MRHAVAHRKLRRNPSHRKALLRNLMNALVRSERIETTVAKAKELRPLADKLITLGKRNTTHARRQVFSLLSDKGNTEKLFSGLAGRFEGRQGGYTRIVRTHYRVGDGADMAIIEYIPTEEKKAGGRRKTKKKGPAGKEKAAPPRKRGAPEEKAKAGEKERKTRTAPAKKKEGPGPSAKGKPAPEKGKGKSRKKEAE